MIIFTVSDLGKKKKNAQEVKQLKRGGIDKQQALKQISG